MYSHYGTGIGSGEAYKAAGVQLALWEISHDQGWRTHFSVDTWYRSGKFQYTGGATEMRDYASLILDQVYNNTGAAGGHATYYQSLPQDRAAYGQGYLGAIPEPTTMVLLGVGLLVGGVLRKRR